MTYLPDTASQIAHWLRLWRERAGLRQVEAAQHLGVCQTTISSWEKGRTSIDWRSLRLLADLYGVSAQELGGALLGRDQAAAAV